MLVTTQFLSQEVDKQMTRKLSHNFTTFFIQFQQHLLWSVLSLECVLQGFTKFIRWFKSEGQEGWARDQDTWIKQWKKEGKPTAEARWLPLDLVPFKSSQYNISSEIWAKNCISNFFLKATVVFNILHNQMIKRQEL